MRPPAPASCPNLSAQGPHPGAFLSLSGRLPRLAARRSQRASARSRAPAPQASGPEPLSSACRPLARSCSSPLCPLGDGVKVKPCPSLVTRAAYILTKSGHILHTSYFCCCLELLARGELRRTPSKPELLRIPLPRTWVHKGKRKGRPFTSRPRGSL